MKDIHELARERFAEDTTWMQQTGGYAKDMTLRDHFAGLAMQACLAQESILKDPEPAFKWSYKMADAMLKERSK